MTYSTTHTSTNYWQPIHTAPKTENYDSILLGFAQDEEGYDLPSREGFWNCRLNRWVSALDPEDSNSAQPTHWQPLPESPKPSYKVHLTYFKAGGKYYCEGELMASSQLMPYQIGDVIRKRRASGDLPGLIKGHSLNHYTIHVNVPDHPSNVPFLIMAEIHLQGGKQ
jgi:hypothetical protein